MGGIAVKKGSSTTSYTGTQYQYNAGTKHLYIRTGTGTNDIISYPLTTKTSASQYCSLAFNVNGSVCYLAKQGIENQTTAGFFINNITTASQQIAVPVATTRGMNPSGNYTYSSTTFNTYYTRYSITNQKGSTYTASIPYNNYGVTNSNTVTQTYGQSTIELITNTSANTIHSYTTNGGIANMTSTSSSTLNVYVGTYPVNTTNNRVSDYYQTGYNSIAGATRTLSYNSYYTITEGGNATVFYNNASVSNEYTRAWVWETVSYPNWEAYNPSVNKDARFSLISTHTMYKSITGYSQNEEYVEEPAAGTGMTYRTLLTKTLQESIPSEGRSTVYTNSLSSTSTISIPAYYKTYSVTQEVVQTLYAQTIATHSIPRNTTYTNYGTTTYRYPSGATTTGSTTGEVQTGYTAGYYTTNSTYTSKNYTGQSNAEDWWDAMEAAVGGAAWENLGVVSENYISLKTTTLTHSATAKTDSVYSSTKSSTKSPPNYGYGTMPYWSITSSTTSKYTEWSTHGDEVKASISAKYSTKRGVTTSTQWNAKVNSTSYTAKANITKATLTTGSSSVTYSVKSAKATGYKTAQSYVAAKYAYSTSTKFGYSSTYTGTVSTSRNSTKNDWTYMVYGTTKTHPESYTTYRSTATSRSSYDNTLTRWSQYNTTTQANSYTTESRYTLTSSSRNISKETKTYNGTITNYSFTRTILGNNANI